VERLMTLSTSAVAVAQALPHGDATLQQEGAATLHSVPATGSNAADCFIVPEHRHG